VLPALLVGFMALVACRGGSPETGVRASGHVEADEVRVATKIAGRITSLAVEEGDAIAAGAEIARVDTVDLELSLTAAQADAGRARAELDLLLAGSRAEEIQEAAALRTRAEAEAEAARLDLERQESLLASGSGTTKGRDDARARRDATAASVDAAAERLRRLRSGSRPEEIATARAKVAVAEARSAQVRQQIQDAVVLSPAAGRVTEKIVEAGEIVPAGAVLAVVTDLATPWLTVYVDEPDLDRLRLGQEAEVTTDGGETRRGRISYIASAAEFTPRNVQTRDERVKLVFKVKIALPNEDGLFKPGMPAEARLATSAGT
jgi:HlyD family secretion protein